MAGKNDNPANPAKEDSESEDEKDVTARVAQPTSDTHKLQGRPAKNPRLNPPTPARWKRILLILFLLFLFWLVLRVRARAKKPQIIYASRYSKEYKYRPAASPIITEALKDGRTRLRGALPTGL
ncbi:uncharacterized protein LAESUDRAFT_730020 [Laetiporus sulphureus 93-53]|uniref:Uncharacterized protein n=1 Tax=Laetiporus sulphureus 93-53 TaxID=1314785 RepID=A0A165CBX2_9APHY|nr:uncharacterized protein LAESUDRAFT_730020 [Laetiporus sulphureus 93-53]KZT02533.1 hypothetical protein LAESUDRAFT_730020 [Laetiporus sulphureus 93-53]